MNNYPNIESSFPHPVLGNSDDIIDGKFIINARGRAINGKYEYMIIADIGTQNEDYDNLLENNQAVILIDVYCQQTLYKRSTTSTEKTIPLTFDQADLRGIVELTAYLIATEDITKIRFEKQNSFFGDTEFRIDKGDWLGVSNKIRHYIEPPFDKDYLNNKKPIIIIEKDMTSTKNFFKVKWTEDQLVVLIPEKLYKKWSPYNISRYKYINWCAIILPVLTETINKIYSGDYSQQQDLKWYHVVQQELEKLDLGGLDSLAKAQILLDGPFSEMIQQLKPLDIAFQGELE